MTRDEVLLEVTKTIVEAAQPRKVVVFGSQARGAARPDSDFDILVIEDAPFGPGRSKRKEAARLARILAPVPIPQDILVYSVAEVERWKGERNHVVARALREGVVVYERV